MFNPQVETFLRNNWKRFLDDCLLIWKTSFAHPSTILDILNTLHIDIQFTNEISNLHTVPFLDLLISITDGKINTDIFYKATDTHRYLPFHSCHPKHIKINIPYNLALCLRAIISSNNILEERFHFLRATLKQQGYPPHLIEDAISKAKLKPRNNLIQTQNTSNCGNNIIFIQTYNPNHPSVTNTLTSTLSNLCTDSKAIFLKIKKLLKC